jgi:hypothetical protein
MLYLKKNKMSVSKKKMKSNLLTMLILMVSDAFCLILLVLPTKARILCLDSL